MHASNDFGVHGRRRLFRFAGKTGVTHTCVLFFMGENQAFPSQNARINGALAGLGSSMFIFNDIFDSGFHTATGNQIANDPFNAGVASFVYAAPSEVLLGGNGNPLFFGTEDQVFVAYEGAQPAPEPATLLLMALGLAGVGLRRRGRN